MLGLMAIMLFSLGLPAFATTGQPGPTPPSVGDPVVATNEVQMVRQLGLANGGFFKLVFNGTATADITWNYRGSDIETALEAINAPWDIVDVSASYGSSQGAGLRAKSVQVTFNKVMNGATQEYQLPEMTVAAGSAALTGSRAVFGVLHAGIDATQTTFDVDEIVLPPVTPFDILVDGEQMTVTGRAGGPGQFTYTVTRGGGTGAAVHALGAKVSSATATPFVVVETAQNGVGAVAGQVSPHGGFSSVTNYCLQCHGVHSYEYPPNSGTLREPGEYALMVGASVTDTCNTCHKLFGSSSWAANATNSNAITGKPVIPGGMGTSSMRSAYDGGDGQYLNAGPAVPGHQLGAPDSPDGVLLEGGPGTVSATQGGLYCASCHTPHGDFGQLINSVQFRSEAAGGLTNEIQRITLTNPNATTGGSFTLTWNDPGPAAAETTAPIPWNAAYTDIQAALDAFTTIVDGVDVVVSGTVPALTPPAVGFDVQFTGQYAGVNVAQMTVGVQTVGGVTISTPVAGGGPAGDLLQLFPWQNNSRFLEGRSTVWYLWFDTTRNTWLKCSAINAGGTCTTITEADYLTTVDMEGQLVSLYGYKLLSSKPNATSVIESWGMGQGGHDGARWCTVCHPTKRSVEVGGTYHSHPGSCTYCHGNPADGTSFDFPHTSTNGSLLKEYPDALCISCHSAGSVL